jgi:hypothetical protein
VLAVRLSSAREAEKRGAIVELRDGSPHVKKRVQLRDIRLTVRT